MHIYWKTIHYKNLEVHIYWKTTHSKNLGSWKYWTFGKLTFLEFWNIAIFKKSVYFLILNNFCKNGSPGQTTMLMRRAAKFCVEPRSPFSYISHHDPKTLGKCLIIVSWPECRPEFPNDDDGGGGFPRTLSIWSCPGSITRRDQISRAGNP